MGRKLGKEEGMPQYEPVCMTCIHWHGDLTCEAFKERIPDAIIECRHNHKTHIHGDNGVLYTEDKKVVDAIKIALKGG